MGIYLRRRHHVTAARIQGQVSYWEVCCRLRAYLVVYILLCGIVLLERYLPSSVAMSYESIKVDT